jgi:predicted RNase H-like nuclease (RuvC/YqgF family)
MDDVFEPAIGIRQLALNVASYKKSVKKVEKQMTTMSQEHDRELTEQRVVLSQQQQDIQRLHSSVRQLNFENAEMIREIQDLKQKIALLEKGGVVPK